MPFRIFNLESSLSSQWQLKRVCDWEKVTGEKTALIFVSGGTTGTPKAVELSHNALSISLYSFHNPYHNIYWKPKDLEQSVFMGMFPQFFHVSGSLVSWLVAIPTLLNLLINSPRCTEETIRSLNTLICGADPVPRSSIEAFRKKFKLNIDILEGAVFRRY
ncbi:hypothetical protein Avbf_08678 [Armadillidium vulgare]|nr:hypothetical protein Avbf_08678 [Armadillidium vulgare]